MGEHHYHNPGPKETHTTTSIDGTVAMPATTHVVMRDGGDEVEFAFSDLDALDETVKLFEQARAEHVSAICDGRSEIVHADQLAQDDLAVIDGELVMVDTVVLTDEFVIVRYARKYAGLYDFTADRSMTVARNLRVRRLLSNVTLAAVR